MALVNVTNVDVRNNPARVTEGFELEVVFECLHPLEADLEWKLIYVGNAEDKSLDQELDCVVMGPISRGAMKFVFATEGPDFSKISSEDIEGFTIVLLTGAYREEEFIRIGWYVHNVYMDPLLEENPPESPILEKMQRIILTEAPRVTRFSISWDQPRIPVEAVAGPVEVGEGSSSSARGDFHFPLAMGSEAEQGSNGGHIQAFSQPTSNQPPHHGSWAYNANLVSDTKHMLAQAYSQNQPPPNSANGEIANVMWDAAKCNSEAAATFHSSCSGSSGGLFFGQTGMNCGGSFAEGADVDMG